MSREKQFEERRDISDIIFWSGYGLDRGTCNDISKQIQEQGYRKQSEWISVDDRLPEDEQMVLTIDTEGEMQVCFYETERKGVFQQFHGLVSIYNVTHWMPLPEPPKMKGGAE